MPNYVRKGIPNILDIKADLKKEIAKTIFRDEYKFNQPVFGHIPHNRSCCASKRVL